MDDSSIVKVYAAANEIEAAELKTFLDDAGIDSQVVGDKLHSILGGAYGGLEPGAQIWVRLADESRAREILMRCEQQRTHASVESETTFWTCPQCGEQVESDFDVCWNCETPRECI